MTVSAGLDSRCAGNSAAAEAGLQSGDILLSFNGMDIEKSHQLPLFIGSVLPGTKATFEVLRNGNIITVTAVWALWKTMSLYWECA